MLNFQLYIVMKCGLIFCQIGIIPWTFNSNNTTSKAQRYQLHKESTFALYFNFTNIPINHIKRQIRHQQFSHLPYTNNFLEISLECSNHVLVKIEFRVPLAMFLPHGIKKFMYIWHILWNRLLIDESIFLTTVMKPSRMAVQSSSVTDPYSCLKNDL